MRFKFLFNITKMFTHVNVSVVIVCLLLELHCLKLLLVAWSAYIL